MKPTLLVLAAGMGSRYGGLKQMDGMGPSGETVIDYSVYDAISAGFARVVFIIREDFAEDFQSVITAKFNHRIEVDFVFQSLDDLPYGYFLPEGRTKPWGTTHALLAARDKIKEPFALINADDFYGRDGFIKVAETLSLLRSEHKNKQYVNVTYKLGNTLSDYGSVNRGICRTSAGMLESVEEHVQIEVEKDGICRGLDLSGRRVELSLVSDVSMNLWGFMPSIFGYMEADFLSFMAARGGELESECYIPSVIDRLIREGEIDCRMVSSSGQWFGVTYPEDKKHVVRNIRDLVVSGEYPEVLWE